jgi:hypothetical protein
MTKEHEVAKEAAEWSSMQTIMGDVEKVAQGMTNELSKAITQAPTRNLKIWSMLVQAIMIRTVLELHMAGSDPSFLEEIGLESGDQAILLANNLRWQVDRDEIAGYEKTLDLFEKSFQIIREKLTENQPPVA